MAKRNDTQSVDVERGFGTGLRVKLEGRSEPTDSPVAAEEQEPETGPAPEEELSETEQLWAELEESLAREEQLKRALEEQVQAFKETKGRERRLAKRADALQRRERELAEQIRAFEAAKARAETSEPENGRAYLRRRVEENGELLWRVFQGALTAAKANGEPDLRTRLVAAATILAEAYGEVPQLSPGEQVAAARDELAGIRAKRAAKPRTPRS